MRRRAFLRGLAALVALVALPMHWAWAKVAKVRAVVVRAVASVPLVTIVSGGSSFPMILADVY